MYLSGVRGLMLKQQKGCCGLHWFAPITDLSATCNFLFARISAGLLFSQARKTAAVKQMDRKMGRDGEDIGCRQHVSAGL